MSCNLIEFQQDLILQDWRWKYIPSINDKPAMVSRTDEYSASYIVFNEEKPDCPTLKWFTEAQNFIITRNAFDKDKDKALSVWLNEFWKTLNTDVLDGLLLLGYEILSVGKYFKTDADDVCIPFQLKFNKEQYGL